MPPIADVSVTTTTTTPTTTAPQLDVRTPAEITEKATPMRAPLDVLLQDMHSSLAGRDRLLHERADELVSVRNQLQHVLQDVRQQQRLSTPDTGEQQRGLERQLFETKAEAADLTRKLRAAQTELAELRQRQEATQTLDKVLYERDAQVEELRAERKRLEEELRVARLGGEKSVRLERERSVQAVSLVVFVVVSCLCYAMWFCECVHV